MKRHDVCVRGSGAVGRSLALALARQGLQVALQGSAAPPPTGPDVRAYALNAASVALLTELRVWDALPRDAATAVHDMHVQGDARGAHVDFSAWEQRQRELAWIVDAAALDAALADAVRFAPHIADAPAGEVVDATLLAVCEGKASATRDALRTTWQRHDYAQTAVAARLVADAPHRGRALQWFRSPDILALLPFDRPVAERSYGLVWSLPTARAHEVMSLDSVAFEQALADATRGAAGALRLASERAAWPLALARAERWCGPGWVLLGDAAHVVHPLAGQGLNLGLADVRSLARVVAAREPWRSVGDEKLLRRYVRERAWPTRAMSGVTDGLLHLFASEQAVVKELRNRGLDLVDAVPPLKRWLAARALDS